MFDNRFLIRFKAPVLAIEEDIQINKVSIWQDATHIHIRSTNALKSVQLIDFNGKIINVFKGASLPTHNYQSGVYVVKLTTINNQTITKKIVIK